MILLHSHLNLDHTQSWGFGVPKLLTECYDDNGVLVMPEEFGAIIPTREETYTFLRQFFGEIFNVFPDPFVHLGGDEISYYCWYVQIFRFLTKNMQLLNLFMYFLIQGQDIQRSKLFWPQTVGE